MKKKLDIIIAEAGYNRTSLAEKMGLSRQAVAYWANGKKNPSKDNLVKMSKILKVGIDQICKSLKK